MNYTIIFFPTMVTTLHDTDAIYILFFSSHSHWPNIIWGRMLEENLGH